MAEPTETNFFDSFNDTMKVTSSWVNDLGKTYAGVLTLESQIEQAKEKAQKDTDVRTYENLTQQPQQKGAFDGIKKEHLVYAGAGMVALYLLSR
jgi:hypothetical protein